ncbi:hypothetical protein EV586_102406 [Tumebacillus sp. BK434]|uniref:hypothetical protein n=1 Tax=Tumebacillus sp. BK434 TaxID=2512169 RepID=UPI001051B00A|nr:hypothetical protein [Tumebacillus sp. BK434]TCP57958.1 hypothetical protein EV586_102406 [Tumebacillus sp. BK434]
MEVKKRERWALLLVLVLTVLFGGLYFAERSENAKLWWLMNQNEANQFFPALAYLQDWEARLDSSMPFPPEILQANRDSLSRSALSLQEVVTFRSYLFDEDAFKHPSHLTDFMLRTDRQLSAMIDGGGQEYVADIKATLHKINAVTREVYNFDSGLTSEQWDELREIGFLQDQRLVDWYTKVEAAIAP